MFKQSRRFFSAAMIAFLFASTLIFTNNALARKRRCPVEPPKTLLSLYLDSDTVVIADFKSEKVTKTEDETADENGYYASVERELAVVSTFKGQKRKEISFAKSEYISTPKADEDGESAPDLEYVGGNMHGDLTVGKRYLFFLAKNVEDGEIYQTDYRSAGREITRENADVYEKRLNELGAILADKKNQTADVAEWLVRLTEDEETRWDGANALSRSFTSLSYETEQEAEETEVAEKISANAEDEKETPTAIDEAVGEYSSAIAKRLTDAQKQRISDVFFESLNKSLLNAGERAAYDYSLAELVAHWDGARFAIFGFQILHAMDRTDAEKTFQMMSFVGGMTGDHQLSSISYEYYEIKGEQETEDEDLREVQAQVQTTETHLLPNANDKNKLAGEIVGDVDETIEKPNRTQLRERIYQKFADRYQVILARDFAPEPETESAENTGN